MNHPLRHRGITIYQADWSLAAINLQIGGSPVLQLPLQTFPQLGEQVWGIVLPTRPDGTAPVLLSLESEQGPVQVFGEDGERIALLRPGGPAEEVRGLPLRVDSVLPASGLLLKRDPGVPLVYLGFAVTLLGGGLSLVATRQLWAIAADGQLHVGGCATATWRRSPRSCRGCWPSLETTPQNEWFVLGHVRWELTHGHVAWLASS